MRKIGLALILCSFAWLLLPLKLITDNQLLLHIAPVGSIPLACFGTWLLHIGTTKQSHQNRLDAAKKRYGDHWFHHSKHQANGMCALLGDLPGIVEGVIEVDARPTTKHPVARSWTANEVLAAVGADPIEEDIVILYTEIRKEQDGRIIHWHVIAEPGLPEALDAFAQTMRRHGRDWREKTPA